ncbi:hypothetical protein P9112_003090 [Eukaryota sp. TZLM1-RC]
MHPHRIWTRSGSDSNIGDVFQVLSSQFFTTNLIVHSSFEFQTQTLPQSSSVTIGCCLSHLLVPAFIDKYLSNGLLLAHSPELSPSGDLSVAIVNHTVFLSLSRTTAFSIGIPIRKSLTKDGDYISQLDFSQISTYSNHYLNIINSLVRLPKINLTLTTSDGTELHLPPNVDVLSQSNSGWNVKKHSFSIPDFLRIQDFDDISGDLLEWIGLINHSINCDQFPFEFDTISAPLFTNIIDGLYDCKFTCLVIESLINQLKETDGHHFLTVSFSGTPFSPRVNGFEDHDGRRNGTSLLIIKFADDSIKWFCWYCN